MLMENLFTALDEERQTTLPLSLPCMTKQTLQNIFCVLFKDTGGASVNVG